MAQSSFVVSTLLGYRSIKASAEFSSQMVTASSPIERVNTKKSIDRLSIDLTNKRKELVKFFGVEYEIACQDKLSKFYGIQKTYRKIISFDEMLSSNIDIFYFLAYLIGQQNEQNLLFYILKDYTDKDILNELFLNGELELNLSSKAKASASRELDLVTEEVIQMLRESYKGFRKSAAYERMDSDQCGGNALRGKKARKFLKEVLAKYPYSTHWVNQVVENKLC